MPDETTKSESKVAAETEPAETSSDAQPEAGSSASERPADGEPPESAESTADAEAPDEAATAEDGLEPDEIEGSLPVGGDMSPEELEEARANEVAFSWQASEYVHHHKGVGWYSALAGGVASLLAVLVWLHYWLETAVIVVMAVAVVVYARKPPRTLTYELTPKYIMIEGKQYPFTDFRSFGVLKDDDWHSIDLEPLKRFAPRITVLFDSDDFDSIVGHLELHLPRTDRNPDMIERASRYLRF